MVAKYIHHFASAYGWTPSEILALSMQDANALFGASLEAQGHRIRPIVDDPRLSDA
jgi:hypothetical protein